MQHATAQEAHLANQYAQSLPPSKQRVALRWARHWNEYPFRISLDKYQAAVDLIRSPSDKRLADVIIEIIGYQPGELEDNIAHAKEMAHV